MALPINSKGFLVAKHSETLNTAAWRKRWPNFSATELDSDDFSLRIYAPALDALQKIRDAYGLSLIHI